MLGEVARSAPTDRVTLVDKGDDMSPFDGRLFLSDVTGFLEVNPADPILQFAGECVPVESPVKLLAKLCQVKGVLAPHLGNPEAKELPMIVLERATGEASHRHDQDSIGEKCGSTQPLSFL